MPGRMTNRDRIARLAAEKTAERREKEVKKKVKATAPRTTRKSTARKAAPVVTGARRLVWLVCDQAGNPVKTYPYPRKDEATAEAARLTASKGKLHFVKNDKVAME